MIKSSGNVAILKSRNYKFVELWMGSKILLFAYEHRWGVGTTFKHPKTINGNVKNLSKRIER